MTEKQRLRELGIDYDELAKHSGQNAYNRAVKNGLGEKEARRLQKIFGASIPEENRLSSREIISLRAECERIIAEP